MQECHYCLQHFSTRQRLLSHLNRVKKCYVVDETNLSPSVSESLPNPIQPLPNPIQPLPESLTSATDVNVSNLDFDSRFQCQVCDRVFITEGNLNRHVLNNRCPQPKPILESTTTPPVLISKTRLKPKPIRETTNTTMSTPDVIAVGMAVRTQRVKPDPAPIIAPIDLPIANGLRVDIVKYLERENYFEYLTHLCGSSDDSIKFIRNCVHRKLTGDVDLLNKIYFEGRSLTQYPFEMTDLKTHKMYYKTPNGIVLDENGLYIRNLLIGNLQDCYLKFSNHIISSNYDNTDEIFSEENNLQQVQEHIYELSNDKTKTRLLMMLIELIEK